MQNYLNEFASLKNKNKFLNIYAYKNNYGEIADYSLTFNFDYYKYINDCLNKINKIKTNNHLALKAKDELINSFQDSLTGYNYRYTNYGVYKNLYLSSGEIINGIKLHIETNVIHLFGLILHKNIIKLAVYPNKQTSDFIKIKNSLKKEIGADRYRQFKLIKDRFKYIETSNFVIKNRI